jgi:hypothetical protein
MWLTLCGKFGADCDQLLRKAVNVLLIRSATFLRVAVGIVAPLAALGLVYHGFAPANLSLN